MPRFATMLAIMTGFGAFSAAAQADLLYYDGQRADGTYTNTSYDSDGLDYTLANGDALHVTNGKRTTPGDGSKDAFTVDTAVFDAAGLYDSASGTIGGGSVSGTMYLSFLGRAHYGSSSTTENKSGDGPHGARAGMELSRSNSTVLGVGNAWSAWAYSAYDATGMKDLKQAGSGQYKTVNTDVHLFVVKITFNANGNDDIAVWLDPDTDAGDAQVDSIHRWTATNHADYSFDQLGYTSGNIPDVNSWDFDEVRIGQSWASVTAIPEPAALALLLPTLAAYRRR